MGFETKKISNTACIPLITGIVISWSNKIVKSEEWDCENFELRKSGVYGQLEWQMENQPVMLLED